MNANAMLKQTLVEFWNKFGGRKVSGVGFDPLVKLVELQRLARLVIPYHHQTALDIRRKDFDDNKHRLHPWKRFGRCFVCEGWATGRHHIVQLQNGGINSKKNMVSICDGCHAKIHPWL